MLIPSICPLLTCPVPQVVVKIFTRVLVPDVEYKTLSISKGTTCREVIRMLLAKFRLRHRDPNLFFLTIDVWMRKAGVPVRSVMVLDERTCPAQLQLVYPQQGAKFTLQMRRGGIVKVVDDSCSLSSPSVAVAVAVSIISVHSLSHSIPSRPMSFISLLRVCFQQSTKGRPVSLSW